MVTGAAGGIGRATAMALAEAGATVVVADLAGMPTADVVNDLKSIGANAAACDVDISDESSVMALIQFAVDTFGGLDIVDNNAAATNLTATDFDVTTMSVEMWDQTMATNLRGPMLMCKHAIPRLIERGGGSIVIISSGQALSGDLGTVAYASSKSGLLALMRHVATTFGPQGIRCNAIAPGLIETPTMLSQMPLPVRELFAEHCSVPRVGLPIDIANGVVFLASERSAYITGHVLSIDGGLLAHVPTVRDIRQMMAGLD
ncbi:MAG: short-chain dehydrogenase/reductase [Acidimicrobiia bacterium]|nr:short-chain dehydrogenase/reductase [Acidimicrobiia bacterium]